ERRAAPALPPRRQRVRASGGGRGRARARRHVAPRSASPESALRRPAAARRRREGPRRQSVADPRGRADRQPGYGERRSAHGAARPAARRRRDADHRHAQSGLCRAREPPQSHARRPTGGAGTPAPSRPSGSGSAMTGLIADLKHAWRIYRRTPFASAAAALALAVAMAFVTSFISLYVDLLLKPHPGFEDSRRLVTYGWNNGQNAGGLPYSLIERIADEASTLAFAAGQQPAQLMIGADREPAY